MLSHVVVDESYRKRGIGSKLQDHVLTLAEEEGFSFFFLFSEEENFVTHKMLEKAGFKKGKKFFFFSKKCI